MSAPRAFGALGRFDRERVLAAAAGMSPAMRVVHEDRGSILLLDRDPVSWDGGGGRRGLCWPVEAPWTGRPRTWGEAAAGGAPGLVLDGRRRFVHSGIAGREPIYWRDAADATHFGSAIDALVEVAPGSLSIDWDAWAAIIATRFPLGRRTPFAEIGRLGPYETLRRRLGRGKPESHIWPWAEVEPELDAERGADAVAEALRSSLASNGPALCPLSGGEDSRLLCAALPADARAESRALTVNDDEGGRFEEELAERVAARLGIAWEPLEGGPYRRDWELRADRVEYQFVDHAWLVPLVRRVAGSELPVLDGYGIDSMLRISHRFPTSAGGDRIDGERMFNGLRLYGQAELALAPALRDAITRRAKEQFDAAIRPYEEHRSSGVICFYLTRTVRGITTYPSGLLGSVADVVAPGGEDGVARAMLLVDPAPKREARLHKMVSERLAPGISAIPSTQDAERSPELSLPRRWRSPEALEMMRELLADGPLASYVEPGLNALLADTQPGELTIHQRIGMEAVAMMHAWWRRYRDRLHPVNVADLLG